VKNWALHHIHLLIYIDFTLHVLMMAALLGAAFTFYKMTRLPKPPGTERKLNILMGIMGLIIAFIAWNVFTLSLDCFRQYPVWWNR
jgi:hypothetical protein